LLLNGGLFKKGKFFYLAPGGGNPSVDESDVRESDRVLLLVEDVEADVEGNGDQTGGDGDAQNAEAHQPTRSLQTFAQALPVAGRNPLRSPPPSLLQKVYACL